MVKAKKMGQDLKMEKRCVLIRKRLKLYYTALCRLLVLVLTLIKNEFIFKYLGFHTIYT